MHKNLLSCGRFAPLSLFRQSLYAIVAFFIVAFGQPAWTPQLGLIAACVGYALFWRLLICFSIPSHRFWLSFLWIFSVQLMQLSWFVSHPFLYIYAVYLFVAALFGVQFGIIGLLINPRMISSLGRIITIASLWTCFEWSRLYILSGFSFNPVGIALGGSLYALQMAALWGVFGLSFWVFLTNLLTLRMWISSPRSINIILWAIVAVFPYIFGAIHLNYHDKQIALQINDNNSANSKFNAVLVQTAFPVEESITFDAQKNMIYFVSEEWRKILTIIKQHLGKPIDLIALPEFVVPFGTYANVYAYDDVVDIFKEVLGNESLNSLPSPTWPLGDMIQQPDDEKLMVSNAFWAQSIANVFNAGIIAGLEDAEDLPGKEREYYSSAIFLRPQIFPKENTIINQEMPHYPERYEKRVLVPMGEYIPFAFCRELAQKYGVFGSFTPGTQAKAFQCGQLKISPSICYEETYGNIVREGRILGADMLVNLTNDAWFPNSSLPKQHMEHARFRTVENGIPLLRSCNTGVTAAIDSLGRTIALLGDKTPEKVEWIADALYVQVPTYIYQTLYSQCGDKLIIGFSLMIILISAFFRQFSF